MSSHSKSRLPASKRGGFNAESAVIQLVPELDPVSDTDATHYDARVADVLSPSDRLPFYGMCVLEVGTVVEIKSTMAVSGSNQRRGRFHLRRTQHEHLVEQAGVYLFAVCEPTPTRDLIAAKIVPATTIGGLVESWIDTDDRPPFSKIAWSRIFKPSEVER
ncbi:hypothetical protein [Halalkalirubrum salinum]|uniref:hypothetical protein n=1 Tax=Halalkalirubrum salinum TaxID=2563889 RepID=UPI001484CD2A|nr:hypothetical protein [Halalkalirubrum salinum]